MKKTIRLIMICMLIAAFAVSAFSCSDDPYVSASMTVGEDGTFKILQLTDLHFINANNTSDRIVDDLHLRDEWAMICVTDVIQRANPDLIVVTGDSVFNLSNVAYLRDYNDDNEASFKKVANFIDSFNIPWTLIFGNHDEEGSLKKKCKNDKEATKRALGEYLLSDNIKNCLYVHGPDDITGVGNQIITVKNKDGSLNNALVMFDSGSYLGEDQWNYEWVHDDQLDWYEKAIKHLALQYVTTHKHIKSVIFQHIPFNEYGDVIETFTRALTAQGKDWTDIVKVGGPETTITVEPQTFTYLTSNGTKRTVTIEEPTDITYHFGIYGEGEVCASYVGEWKKNTYDGGHEFERLIDFGSAQAVFCGHDHRNTFSFTYKGLRITYGMSVDYSANGLILFKDNQDIYTETEQRGGTLITLNADSSVSVAQVPFTTDLYQDEVTRRSQK